MQNISSAFSSRLKLSLKFLFVDQTKAIFVKFHFVGKKLFKMKCRGETMESSQVLFEQEESIQPKLSIGRNLRN